MRTVHLPRYSYIPIAAAAVLGAMLVLVSCGDPAAELNNPDPNRRAAAAGAVGQRGDVTAINKLVFSLEDPDPEVARAAEEALGKMGAQGVAPIVNHLRNAADPAVRRSLVRALIAIGPEGAGQLAVSLDVPSEEIFDDLYRVISSYPEAAIPDLVNGLKDGSLVRRKQLSRFLTRLGEPAVGPLVRAADPLDRQLLGDLAFVLLKIGDPSIRYLLNVLASGDDDARAKANALLPLVVVDFPGVAEDAMTSSDERIVEDMTRALQVAGADANGILLDALLDERPDVRRRALDILQATSWEPRTELHEVRALYAGGEEGKALKRLSDLMHDPIGRASAAEAMQRIGVPACPTLMNLLDDPDAELRADALSIADGTDCGGVEKAAFTHFWYDRSPLVRAAALRLLQARNLDVTERLRGLDRSELDNVAREAAARDDLPTMLLLAEAVPDGPYRDVADRMARRHKADHAARFKTAKFDRVRERTRTAVSRGGVALGTSAGVFNDVGGPYEVDLDLISAPVSILVYLDDVEVKKTRADSKNAYYRYTLAIRPRHTARRGEHTVSGKVAIYQTTGQGRRLLAQHQFVQDVDVKADGALKPADVYVYYLAAVRAAERFREQDEGDAVARAAASRDRAEFRRNRLMLRDLSSLADPEISGYATICLALLDRSSGDIK